MTVCWPWLRFPLIFPFRNCICPLICGASIVIADRDQVKDGEKLADLIEKHNITVLQATPSTWRMLLQVNGEDHKTMAVVN